MCGIAGFAGAGGREASERMIGLLRHRGPDATGFYEDPAAALQLAHSRLSILDHEGGAQPMQSGDGNVVVVFNGEIYNQLELRRRLQDLGHEFASDHADTEVLLHGYEEWGEALPGRLNGMWAFCIYDRSRQRLFLSRDRFGQKPLVYTRQAGLFAFASELSALVAHPDIRPSLSSLAVAKYFAYTFIPSPNTIYEGMLKLPAGHNLTFDIASAAVRVTQYWDYVPEPFEELPQDGGAAWGEQLRSLLSQAVERRLQADVPVGVLLSGGIDSSAIVAFAVHHRNDPKDLKTFSIGFHEKSFDESAFASLAAGEFGTDHHAFTYSMDQMRQELPGILKMLDEPLGDSSILPTALLCRETRKNVTVALSGDGGDELFAGYDPFLALRYARAYSRVIPRPVHQGVRWAVSLLPASSRNMSFDFRLRKALQGVSYDQRLWNPVWLSALEPDEIGELMQRPFDVEELYSEAITAWESCRSADLVDKTLQFYVKLYLQDDILTKTDRASMMTSLEARAPFLDIDLVDFARRIPASYKLRGRTTKYLLRSALQPVLPEAIINRPKKGFGVPLAEWFRKWDFDLSSLSGHLNGDFVEQRVADHQAGRRNDKLCLWNLLHLQEFLAERPELAVPTGPAG